MILILSLSVLGGVALGYLLKNFVDKEVMSSMLPDDTNKWVVILGLLVVYLIVMLFHELGHLLTGLLLGFSFQLFVIGFFGMRRNEDGKVEIYLNKEWAYFGGVAATGPRKHDPRNIDIMSKIIIAGPLASILLSFLCFILLPFFAPPYSFFTVVTGFMSIGIFLATTIPSSTGIFYTDRKRYQRLRSGGIESEIEAALMEATGLLASRSSLADMDVKKIDVIQQDEKVFMKYIGLYYKWKYLKDKGREIEPDLFSKMKALEEDIPASIVKWMKKEMSK